MWITAVASGKYIDKTGVAILPHFPRKQLQENENENVSNRHERLKVVNRQLASGRRMIRTRSWNKPIQPLPIHS